MEYEKSRKYRKECRPRGLRDCHDLRFIRLKYCIPFLVLGIYYLLLYLRFSPLNWVNSSQSNTSSVRGVKGHHIYSLSFINLPPREECTGGIGRRGKPMVLRKVECNHVTIDVPLRSCINSRFCSRRSGGRGKSHRSR